MAKQKDLGFEEALIEFIENDSGPEGRTMYMGIDPGVTGSISVLSDKGGVKPLVVDIPTLKVELSRKLKSGNYATRSEYNTQAICRFFEIFESWRHRERVHIVVCLEKGQPMRKDTPLTSFSVGVGFGMWSLFLAYLGYELELVVPVSWKRNMELLGKGKEASRAKAMKLWPKAPLWLKKHHNRAESLLIAESVKRKRNAR